MTYLERATKEFIAGVEDYVIVDEEGDPFLVHAEQKGSVEAFAEELSTTTATEDRELRQHVHTNVDLDQDPETLVDDVIEIVQGWFGIT